MTSTTPHKRGEKMKKEPAVFIKDINDIHAFLMMDAYKDDYFEGYKSAR